MDTQLVRQLQVWAATYHCPDFIQHDPVQFPHRYQNKQDIEISGLLTALLSFGNRKQIIRKAEVLDLLMQPSPLAYVRSGKWKADFPAMRAESFYRMLSFADMNVYFRKLYQVYISYESLEDCLMQATGSPMQRLCSFLEVSSKSPQKKLNMFLRWMIRKGPVDLGIWRAFSPQDLLIPLDTHVCQVAYRLGLVEMPTYSLSNARKITSALAEVFPDDPCLGDFALFGYGVNHSG